MMQDEILRIVDTIHRSKEIEKDVIFLGIEAALLSAVKKKYGENEEARVSIDPHTGDVTAFDGENEVSIDDLGRLAAMAGKQVLFQKIREAERDRVFEEFESKVKTLVVGIVQRQEGPNLIVNLGKVEGFLPRSEQVPGERFRVGDRIKVLIKDLKKNANRVKILLSRGSPEIVRCLFELEVPEIAEKVIEVKEIAREPGYRTKIAVTTYDNNVDCVGACVGVRGSRIKNIVDELFGEKIDIVRWNESIEVLLMNALKPAEISSLELDFERMKAIVYVRSDQQSLAIGKRGQNVRLASKLSGWELDIVPVSEEELEQMRREEAAEPDDDIDDIDDIDGIEDIEEEGEEGGSETLDAAEVLANLELTHDVTGVSEALAAVAAKQREAKKEAEAAEAAKAAEDALANPDVEEATSAEGSGDDTESAEGSEDEAGSVEDSTESEAPPVEDLEEIVDEDGIPDDSELEDEEDDAEEDDAETPEESEHDDEDGTAEDGTAERGPDGDEAAKVDGS